MRLEDVQTAAELVFEMRRPHQDICPHRYRYIETVTVGGKCKAKYRCDICSKVTSDDVLTEDKSLLDRKYRDI